MKEEKSNVNNKLIIILLIILMIAIIGFCILIFLDKILPVNLDTKGFKTDESGELCMINNISDYGNNYKIEGKFLKDDVETYELYISVKNPNEKTKYYRTQIDKAENEFISVIRKNNINENSKLGLVYMCDEEKLLIESDKGLGGKNE